MYSYGPPHMAEQKQDDQLEHTYSSYVRMQDVALKTNQRRWTIGRSGERGSGISVLVARHDDGDDDLHLSFQNISVINFIDELNINNKLTCIDVLIDTNNVFVAFPCKKKPTSNKSCTLNYKSQCTKRYKMVIIKNLIYHAKLISSSKIIYSDLKNIKQNLLNQDFSNRIVHFFFRNQLHKCDFISLKYKVLKSGHKAWKFFRGRERDENCIFTNFYLGSPS